MAFDGADFAGWLHEQGTIEGYVPLYVEAAARLCFTAPTQPLEPPHVDAFLAELRRTGVDEERIEMFQRAAAALLRYQSTARGGRVTFSGLDQDAMATAAAPPPPDIAPYLVDGDEPIRRPVMTRDLTPETSEERRRRRRIATLGATVVLFMIVVVYTVKGTLDAFRYRSHLVPESFYSEHLRFELRFPKERAWRHLTGGDRVSAYEEMLAPVSGRSEGAEIWTSTFFRGEDAREPDLGLSIASVPILQEFWGAGRDLPTIRKEMGESLARVFAEYMAVRGGRWETRYCGTVTEDPRNPVLCSANVYRDGKTFYVDAWVIFGRDRIAVVEFRAREPSEALRQEALTIMQPLRI